MVIVKYAMYCHLLTERFLSFQHNVVLRGHCGSSHPFCLWRKEAVHDWLHHWWRLMAQTHFATVGMTQVLTAQFAVWSKFVSNSTITVLSEPSDGQMSPSVSLYWCWSLRYYAASPLQASAVRDTGSFWALLVLFCMNLVHELQWKAAAVDYVFGFYQTKKGK